LPSPFKSSGRERQAVVETIQKGEAVSRNGASACPFCSGKERGVFEFRSLREAVSHPREKGGGEEHNSFSCEGRKREVFRRKEVNRPSWPKGDLIRESSSPAYSDSKESRHRSSRTVLVLKRPSSCQRKKKAVDVNPQREGGDMTSSRGRGGKSEFCF